MQLYHLGQVSWQDSQLLYHALPRLGRSGLFLLTPRTPYVCIGFHQDAAQEVDLDYCAAAGIPVFRREVGGGAVYLDGNQVFYQLVLPREDALLKTDRQSFYRLALQPAINTLHELGLAAHYKPVNDILVDGRKITGSGAAEITDQVVFVGNILLDFDYSMMARVLRVPDEKYRDKLHQSLKDNLTTCRRELDHPPTLSRVYALLIKHFSIMLGDLEPATINESLRDQADKLGEYMFTSEWLLDRSRRQVVRSLQVRSGIELVEGCYKAPGGLIRAVVEVDRQDLRINSVSFHGDFFIYPSQALGWLEDALRLCEPMNLLAAVQGVYGLRHIETPGVQSEDWVRAIEAALNGRVIR